MVIKSSILIPSTLVVGGIPMGSYFVYRHFKIDSSLVSRLKSDLKNFSHKKILSKDSEEWSKWRIVYEKDTRNQILGVAVQGLPDWCDTQLNGSDSRNYEYVSKWCVINTRSLKQEAVANGKTLISVEGNNATEWEGAWEYYNQNKSGMVISTGTNFSADGSNKTEEGPKLKEWCKGILEKKMYEYIEEVDAYNKAAKWCSSNR